MAYGHTKPREVTPAAALPDSRPRSEAQQMIRSAPTQPHQSHQRLTNLGIALRVLRRDPASFIQRRQRRITIPRPQLSTRKLNEVMRSALSRHSQRRPPASRASENPGGVALLGCRRNIMNTGAGRPKRSPVIHPIRHPAGRITRFRKMTISPPGDAGTSCQHGRAHMQRPIDRQRLMRRPSPAKRTRPHADGRRTYLPPDGAG